MHYDVFNGDADGIIALLQLRLAQPKQGRLITGIKRDISLLKQVVKLNNASSVTVLDISLEKNSEALTTLLDADVEVFYCDHHRSGDIPPSDKLTTLIDLDAEICTSILINNYLQGQYLHWAIAAAYGDNLVSTADVMAVKASLTEPEREFLKELGILINYNGYGATLDDLHISPAELYVSLLAYPDPFTLLDDVNSPYFILKRGYESDYSHVKHLNPIFSSGSCAIFELPNQAWARRISGVFGNELANGSPSKAHGVLTLNPSEVDYTVSVRAPLENRVGADVVCSQFATGGGRRAAAGINQLTTANKSKFFSVLDAFYTNTNQQ